MLRTIADIAYLQPRGIGSDRKRVVTRGIGDGSLRGVDQNDVGPYERLSCLGVGDHTACVELGRGREAQQAKQQQQVKNAHNKQKINDT